MRIDLFGNKIEQKEEKISIFCDERKVDKYAHPNDEEWIYIGILFVPQEKLNLACEILNKCRKIENFYGEVKFHKVNRKGRGAIEQVAKRWIDQVVLDNDKIFFYNLLGINKNRLLFELFGKGNTREGKFSNIYNRFFRSAFLCGVNLFFSKDNYGKIIVDNIYHDSEGFLQKHDFFPWHLQWRLGQKDMRITFLNDKIKFVRADPKKEKNHKAACEMIQLSDILIGSFSECLDNLAPKNKGKNNLSSAVIDLLDDILNEKYYSKYEYFKRINVSFFPSRELTLQGFLDIYEKSKSTFYQCRPILKRTSKFTGNLFNM